MYKSYLASYFDHWKDQKEKKRRHKKRTMVMQIEMEGEGLQKEVVAGQKKAAETAEAVSTARRKTCTRVMKKFANRTLIAGVASWRAFVEEERKKEGKAEVILMKMRNNLVG